MKIRSVYFYVITSFSIGFIICLAGMTIEDVLHNFSLIQALSQPVHFMVPLLLGLLAGLGGFLYRSNKLKQVEAVNRYTENLNSLLKVNSAITSSLDQEVVLQTVIDQSVRLLDIQTGAIYLTDGSSLYLGAANPPISGEFPEMLRHAEIKDHLHIKRALESGEAVVVPDMDHEELTAEELIAAKTRRLKSVLYFPLIIENRRIGVIILGTVDNLRVFHKGEVDLIKSFAVQAALAVENARLYRDSVITAEELKSQNEEFVELNRKLAESERNYRALFENSNDGIIYLDPVGDIRIVNESAARMHGLEPKDLLNKNIQEFDVEDQSKIMAERFRRMDKGERIRFEVIHQHRDGHLIDIEVSPYRVELDGEPYYIAFHRDITERKRAEEVLRRSEEKYRSLFNNSQVGMFRTRLDGSEVLEFNEKYLQMLGYTLKEARGKRSTDFWVDKREREIMVDMLKRDSRVSNYEFRLRNRKGEVLNCITSLYLDRENGILEGSVIDISDRKRYEEELRIAKEKAEESDRLKTAFLHNMSHEIRTPMNAILGFSDLVFDEDVSESSRKQYYAIVRNSGDQLLSIVNDILTISSLETKQEKINIDAFDVNVMIRQMETIFRQQASVRGIEVAARTDVDDSGSTILTDGTKITQILSNLLSNALKFTLEGSVKFGVKPVGNDLEFYVTDTGIGVRPDYLDKIFDRFRQAHEYENKKFAGSGLGLSISKGFVELLGGRIWLESEPGVGSTFRFTVPYQIVTRDA
jgi:PAS domain S-box-containing protein